MLTGGARPGQLSHWHRAASNLPSERRDREHVAKKRVARARKTSPPSAELILPPSPAAGAPVINPFGETEQRKIVKSKVLASELKLSDGTKLVVTPLVSDVRRATKQFNANGEPLYFLTIGANILTKAPKKLLQLKPRQASKK
jgi:hypothetical protein